MDMRMLLERTGGRDVDMEVGKEQMRVRFEVVDVVDVGREGGVRK